jgi:hypothetical protein
MRWRGKWRMAAGHLHSHRRESNTNTTTSSVEAMAARNDGGEGGGTFRTREELVPQPLLKSLSLRNRGFGITTDHLMMSADWLGTSRSCRPLWLASARA